MGNKMPQKAKPRQRPYGVSDGGEFNRAHMEQLGKNATSLEVHLQQKIATT
jgi:hypothetical protein